MNIIVCIKQVPDPEAPAGGWTVDSAKGTVNPPSGTQNVISTFDNNAIEAALQLKEAYGGKITAVSMGPASVKDSLKQALALGADEAVHLQDAAFEGSDSLGTATALAAAIKKIGECDLVLTGRQAADWDAGQVGPMLAEVMGVPCSTVVRKIEQAGNGLKIERLIENGFEVIEMPTPSLLTISNEANEPRYPTLKGIMGAGRKPMATWGVGDIGVAADKVGSTGATVKNVKVFKPIREGKCEIIEGETLAEAGANLALRLREAKLI